MRSWRLAQTTLLATALSACATSAAQAPTFPGAGPARTLVLHDETGPYGWLGELYGAAAGHLASHFGPWDGKPARRYRAGDLERYDAVVYVGSTYGEPLPDALLDDVLAGARPVVWVQGNLWQLAGRSPRFAEDFGFAPASRPLRGPTEVLYKGERLGRAAANREGVTTYATLDRARVEVLAEAVGAAGARTPWALRARHLTYVGDNPFAFVDERDRYLAFADLLFDVLAATAPERHRALVRLEDVSPLSRPHQLRAAVDVLAAEGAPFSVGVIPLFVDPGGTYRRDGPGTTALADAPAIVEALRYAVAKGGTLVLHGTTHQRGTAPNPYTGASVDDFEFWIARRDRTGAIVLTGPVPDDSARWAADRVRRGLEEFDRAGLPRPRIFEFPHYAGSGRDARAIAPLIGAAYHRGLYFEGALSGEDRDPSRQIGQIFPFEGRDVYGFAMIPENCGGFRAPPAGGGASRALATLVGCARANRVVRDGWASFYYHPTLGPGPLRQIVRELKRLGYTFVEPPLSPGRTAPSPPPAAARAER